MGQDGVISVGGPFSTIAMRTARTKLLWGMPKISTGGCTDKTVVLPELEPMALGTIPASLVKTERLGGIHGLRRIFSQRAADSPGPTAAAAGIA
jgi:hypothetical protein